MEPQKKKPTKHKRHKRPASISVRPECDICGAKAATYRLLIYHKNRKHNVPYSVSTYFNAQNWYMPSIESYHFTLTDLTPIPRPILIQVTQECTVILSESDTLSESESGSVNGPLSIFEKNIYENTENTQDNHFKLIYFTRTYCTVVEGRWRKILLPMWFYRMSLSVPLTEFNKNSQVRASFSVFMERQRTCNHNRYQRFYLLFFPTLKLE